MRKIIAGTFIMVSLFTFSCSKKVKNGQELFNEGINATKQEKWDDSIENLKEALTKNLTPKQEEIAKISIANAYFKKGDYTEAIIQYREFLKLFPASSYAKEALYKLGISYMKLIKGPEWDQTFTKKALETFNEYLEKYPNTKEAKQVEKLKKTCRKILAEHIIYIGLTYDILHKFTASSQRYKEVMENYSDVEPEDKLLYLYGRANYFISIQAKEEIPELQEKLEKEEERLQKAQDEEEKKVARKRIFIILQDINRLREQEALGKEKGKKALLKLIKQYPNSKYTKNAKKILEGKVIIDIIPVENPIKEPFIKRFFKTI